MHAQAVALLDAVLLVVDKDIHVVHALLEAAGADLKAKVALLKRRHAHLARCEGHHRGVARTQREPAPLRVHVPVRHLHAGWRDGEGALQCVVVLVQDHDRHGPRKIIAAGIC